MGNWKKDDLLEIGYESIEDYIESAKNAVIWNILRDCKSGPVKDVYDIIEAFVYWNYIELYESEWSITEDFLESYNRFKQHYVEYSLEAHNDGILNFKHYLWTWYCEIIDN